MQWMKRDARCKELHSWWLVSLSSPQVEAQRRSEVEKSIDLTLRIVIINYLFK